MDSQQDAHGSAYAYSSSDWPEFYDLWIQHLFGAGPSEDAPVFWDALQTLIDHTEASHIIRVLDVGTGTGRVLQGLIQSAAEHDRALGGRVELWGIDHSDPMVARAASKLEKTTSSMTGNPIPIQPRLLVTTASDFLSDSNETKVLRDNVDLLIFAVGSVCHLVGEGEVAVFLRTVAEALRRAGGIAKAIISVLDEVVEDEAAHRDGPGELPYGVPLTITSQDHPGKIFRKTPTVVIWDAGRNVRTDVFTLSVLVKDGTDGDEVMVREQEMRWSMKTFEEEAWKADIQQAGLEIEKRIDGRIQKWYFLVTSVDHLNSN